MNEKERKKVFYDSMMSGTGIIKTGFRKWYNPMRYIKGKFYVKRIKPKNFYK